MKYSKVTFSDNGRKWSASFCDLPNDREEMLHRPNGDGFYCYPTEMGRYYAFEALRAHLIEKHIEEIALLENSLAGLRAMKFKGQK
jgi:hypothetical protein